MQVFIATATQHSVVTRALGHKNMIKHIVMWRFKEQAEGNNKATNIALTKEKLEALNGKIPGLIHLEVGVDFIQGEASAEAALYSELESKEALSSYQQHPLHQEALSFIKKVICDRQAVDYTV